ncbi:S10 family serine carboxypeptidase-like protein [Labrys sp. 22185]|uniref:S10 family serine carboxypeptidase-like protein n=1 Tax=Labrys sp. 22185 TaxID=3453888 RepID=UPI003F87293E
MIKYRLLCVAALVMLSGCNGSDSSNNSVSSTFDPTPSTTISANALESIQPTLSQPQPEAVPSAWPADHTVVDPNHYAALADFYSQASAAYRSGPNGGPGDPQPAVEAAGLDPSTVDETPSSKHHTYSVNGVTFDYTARAGHLIAYAPENSGNSGGKDAQASIFYMSYTRDDLPKDQRPVTFFWNGGPGEPSIWLHLGSYAPKYLKVDSPNLPVGPNMPDSFPLVDNPQTLLDQTDLVFIDVVGSGYSEAISPHKNKDFWTTMKDAGIFRDFITAYINKYNRQSSPKYLFGESYGGIRTPIVANLLEEAGISQYAPDSSGKPAIVLSGFSLNSPVLDFSSHSLDSGQFASAAIAMDYYKKSSVRGALNEDEFVNKIRESASRLFKNGSFDLNYRTELSQFLALDKLPSKGLMDLATPFVAPYIVKFFIPSSKIITDTSSDKMKTADIVGKLLNYAGSIVYPSSTINDSEVQKMLSSAVLLDNFKELSKNLNESTEKSDSVVVKFLLNKITDFLKQYGPSVIIRPNYSVFNVYDTRMSRPFPPNYSMDFFESAGFYGAIKPYLLDEFDYRNKDDAQLYGTNSTSKDPGMIGGWIFDENLKSTPENPIDSSTGEMLSALQLDPKLKVFVMMGYHDWVCPFYTTEQDLQNSGILPQFKSRVTTKAYEGGHMIYANEVSRGPLRQDLGAFYRQDSSLGAFTSAGLH